MFLNYYLTVLIKISFFGTSLTAYSERAKIYSGYYQNNAEIMKLDESRRIITTVLDRETISELQILTNLQIKIEICFGIRKKKNQNETEPSSSPALFPNIPTRISHLITKTLTRKHNNLIFTYRRKFPTFTLS